MDLISDRETASVPGPTTLPTEASPNRPISLAAKHNALGFRNTGPAEFVNPLTLRGAYSGNHIGPRYSGLH